MNTVEIIELIGVVVAIIFGAVSWFYSKKSKIISEEANKLSEESLKIAKDANKLSEKSIKIAEESININKENVELKSTTNPILLSNKSGKNNIVFNKKDYSDFILLLEIQVTNHSLQPISIKKFSFYIGEGENSIYMYIDKDDLIDIESYTITSEVRKIKNVNKFPMYLQANEMKEVTIAIGLNSADYQQYYARNGVEIRFETTNSQKLLYIPSDNTIEY